MPRPRTIQTPGEAPTEDADTTVIDAPTPSAAEQALPDQSEIDPRKIRRAVLTRQGWVCPAEAPAPRTRE